MDHTCADLREALRLSPSHETTQQPGGGQGSRSLFDRDRPRQVARLVVHAHVAARHERVPSPRTPALPPGAPQRGDVRRKHSC